MHIPVVGASTAPQFTYMMLDARGRGEEASVVHIWAFATGADKIFHYFTEDHHQYVPSPHDLQTFSTAKVVNEAKQQRSSFVHKSGIQECNAYDAETIREQEKDARFTHLPLPLC